MTRRNVDAGVESRSNKRAPILLGTAPPPPVLRSSSVIFGASTVNGDKLVVFRREGFVHRLRRLTQMKLLAEEINL